MAAVTVYSAPDDGCKGRPKHVEHTCRCNKYNTAKSCILLTYGARKLKYKMLSDIFDVVLTVHRR